MHYHTCARAERACTALLTAVYFLLCIRTLSCRQNRRAHRWFQWHQRCCAKLRSVYGLTTLGGSRGSLSLWTGLVIESLKKADKRYCFYTISMSMYMFRSHFRNFSNCVPCVILLIPTGLYHWCFCLLSQQMGQTETGGRALNEQVTKGV